MPCFSPGAQDGQAQGRLKVFRLTLGQGGQAQDSWAQDSWAQGSLRLRVSAQDWAQGWFRLRVTLGSPLQTQENCSASITPNQNPDPVIVIS